MTSFARTAQVGGRRERLTAGLLKRKKDHIDCTYKRTRLNGRPRHIRRFDWDKGNRDKCGKHGVSTGEIESLFNEDRPVVILPDVVHSRGERRLRAIGQTTAGRYVFVVFTVRSSGGKRYIRPISARHRHRKEIEHYEKEHYEDEEEDSKL